MTTSSWYRRSVWNYKGNREYTKSGFLAAKERFNTDDLDVDCSDRHYVITGANSGIGLEIAQEVAKRGGVLHMVCRNYESAKTIRSEIITNTGNDKIHIHTLDLSKPRDVISWAHNFAASQEKIHVLVNNAGCMVHERNIDEDGIEENFAVNTLSVHIITTTLLPVLQKNEDARVVTVTSAGMLVVRLDPIDLMHESMEPFNGRLVYSQNKRQQVVMTLWYAQRYDNVHFSVMHPGWADTPAVRNSIPQFYEMMKENLRTPSEGADTAVWLAISKAALKFPSGFFFQDREPASTHLPLAWTKTSIEEENHLMQKLMLLTEKITAAMNPEETKLPTDNISAVNSHIVANGVKIPVESEKIDDVDAGLSQVSLSKSEEAKVTVQGENEVVSETGMQSPVPEGSTPEPEIETVGNEDQRIPSPEKIEDMPETKEPASPEGEDTVDFKSSSPQPSIESSKELVQEKSPKESVERPPSAVEMTESLQDSPVTETKEPESSPAEGDEVPAVDIHTTEEIEPETKSQLEEEEPAPKSPEPESESLEPESKSPLAEEEPARESPEPESQSLLAEEERTPESPEPESKSPEPESKSLLEEEEPAPKSPTAEDEPALTADAEADQAATEEGGDHEFQAETISDEQHPVSETEPLEEKEPEIALTEKTEDNVSNASFSEEKEEPSPSGEEGVESLSEELKGEPPVEDLLSFGKETVPEAPHSPTESQTPPHSPTQVQTPPHSPTQEQTPSALETNLLQDSLPAESQETTSFESTEADPSHTSEIINAHNHDEQYNSSNSAENEIHNGDSGSPTPSERTYQSAASVVEHLIDITAEKAAASMLS